MKHRRILSRQRGLAAVSLLSAGALLFSATYLGLSALSRDVGREIDQLERRPTSAFSHAPTKPFLGARPGRDLGSRGGIWTNARRTAIENSTANEALFAGIAPAPVVSHTLAVAADPGTTYPWEGNTGGVNTGNGNKLTKLSLLSWKVRGGAVLDFTLYHNSQTNYSDELGAGWTWTYDIYLNNLTGNPVLHWGDGTSVPFTASGGSYTPPVGVHDSLVQNVGGDWTITRKNGTKYFLNSSGFLTKVQDRNANAITFTLNSGNYVTRITDPTGRYLDISLSGGNKFTGITDQAGRSWSFTQNGSGDLTTVTWPSLGDGNTYTDSFAYTSHRITSRTDRRGKGWSYTYNSDGSLASETDPLSHATTYSYSSSATTITDPLGHNLVHNYSGGKLASRVDESGYSISYTAYDSANNPTSTTDARGKVWASTFDSNGNLLTSTDPLGHVKSITYNGFSQPLVVTDALGHTNTYTYDSAGNLLTLTNGLSKTVVSNTIGSYGLLSSTTNALGKTTGFTYTTDGDIASVTDPTGITISMAYDYLGRATSTTDGGGHTATTTYDVWDRPISETLPATSAGAGATRNLTYLPTGQTKTSTDELGHTTTFAYDDARRLTSTTNPKGDVESYGYDNANHRTTVTNGRGKVRTYTFTNRGDISSLTMPDGAVESWTFDGVGHTTAYVNPLSQTILYTYDNAGRQTGVDYPTGTDTAFGYDSGDRRTSMTDSIGTTTWVYDNANQPTVFTSPQGSQTSGYDDAGHRTSLTGTGISRTWTYDDAGRPLTLANESSETTSFSYDTAGRLAKTTFQNGQVSVYGYDARNRQTSVTHKVSNSGSTISTEAYVYDDAGNLSSKTVDGTTTAYGYDNADELTSESRTGYSSTYTYDANGNRTSRTIGGVTDTYTVDDGDKLTSVAQGATTIKSYTYDAAGRTKTVVTSAGTTTLNYDYESRVTGITYPGGATNSFTYNGFDSRVGKVDSIGTATYRRDGAGATAQVLTDGSATYTPGVSQRRSGTTTYDLLDRLGTASRQTSSAASTTATRTYDAFGTLLASTGTPIGPFGFVSAQGYQEDSDSGLKLLGHRYFDSSTGRFITRDTARDGRNWYAYCNSNPLKSVDPSGLSAADILQGIGDGIQNFVEGAAVGVAVVAVVTVLAPEAVCAVIVIGAIAGAVNAGIDIGGAVSGVGMNGEELSTKERVAMATEAVLTIITLGMDGPGGCFVAGTPVLMADGSSKPIESIQPGDQVMTRDEQGNEVTATAKGTVTGTTAHPHAGSLLLKFGDGTSVHTTPEHPFYVKGRGFVHAGELRGGDFVAEDGKGLDRITAIIRIPGTVPVFNLTVAGSHTYFVGTGTHWLWVHNTCEPVDPIDLTTPNRRIHILDGDATGGGHGPGRGVPGKSEFPATWSDDKVIHEISDVATDPGSSSSNAGGGRTKVIGTRDGIEITVILGAPGQDPIITGYPSNVPRNP